MTLSRAFLGAFLCGALILPLTTACGAPAEEPRAEIAGVELPAGLAEIVARNRAIAFPPPRDDFWQAASGLLTPGLDREADARVAEILRRAPAAAFYGGRSYPAGTPGGVLSPAEAQADALFFFDLLRQGYAGYGFFGGDDVFLPLRAAVLAGISAAGAEIAAGAFLSMLADPLRGVIADNNFAIQSARFPAPSLVPYMREELVIRRATDSFGQSFFQADFYGEPSRIAGAFLKDGTPVDCVVPTLSSEGELLYTFGLLAESGPMRRQDPIVMVDVLFERLRDGETSVHELILHKVNTPIPIARHFPLRRRDQGGIAALENRSLWPALGDESEARAALAEFRESGRSLRGAPAAILDMRWNSGGWAALAREWIAGFAGEDPGESPAFVSFALDSLAAEALAASASPWLPAARADSGDDRVPGWISPEPAVGALPNGLGASGLLADDSLLIVLVDGSVRGEAERFLGYLMRMENVLVVGANTYGALLTDGAVSAELPHSGLLVRLGSPRLNLRPDLSAFEGAGFMPDLWVHPRDSLERALAFIERHGVAPAGDLSAIPMPEKSCSIFISSRICEIWPR